MVSRTSDWRLSASLGAIRGLRLGLVLCALLVYTTMARASLYHRVAESGIEMWPQDLPVLDMAGPASLHPGKHAEQALRQLFDDLNTLRNGRAAQQICTGYEDDGASCVSRAEAEQFSEPDAAPLFSDVVFVVLAHDLLTQPMIEVRYAADVDDFVLDASADEERAVVHFFINDEWQLSVPALPEGRVFVANPWKLPPYEGFHVGTTLGVVITKGDISGADAFASQRATLVAMRSSANPYMLTDEQRGERCVQAIARGANPLWAGGPTTTAQTPGIMLHPLCGGQDQGRESVGMILQQDVLLGLDVTYASFSLGDKLLLDWAMAANPQWSTFVELGTLFGVTSLYIGLAAALRPPPAHAHTFDIADLRGPRIAAAFERLAGSLTFHQEDILGPRCMSVERHGPALWRNAASCALNSALVGVLRAHAAAWPRGGHLFMFVDNGMKAMELLMYGRFLRIGDVVMVHDWGPEVPLEFEDDLLRLGFRPLFAELAATVSSRAKLFTLARTVHKSVWPVLAAADDAGKGGGGGGDDAGKGGGGDGV